MTAQLKVTLLGTGSSGGVPRVGGDWGACDPAEPRNRRTRCGILVERIGTVGSTVVLIDTSPDLREQLLLADVRRLDAVVYTHDHADQTHGIDDLRALVLNAPNRRIPVFMDELTRSTMCARFRYVFEGAKGGYTPLLELQPDFVAGASFTVDGPGGPIAFTPMAQDHGQVISFGFRFGSIAYSNDMVDLPEASLRMLEGLELWIADALRYKPHPTHAHLAKTLGWVEQLKPVRTVLTNLHTDMDYRQLISELPPGVEPGYDGWSATLPDDRRFP